MTGTVPAPAAAPAPAPASRRADKADHRRDELAAAALQTLAEQGYARTSLRDIARDTDFSHGVLHYYFTDKIALITHCVRFYKATCVRRYDDLLTDVTAADDLAAAFGAAMAASARDDTALHRLWYDMRSQSMFEPAFRADVLDIDDSLQQMIGRVVTRYAALAGRPVAVDPVTAYAAFDGVFQRALLRHLGGEPDALPALAAAVERLLPTLLA